VTHAATCFWLSAHKTTTCSRHFQHLGLACDLSFVVLCKHFITFHQRCQVLTWTVPSAVCCRGLPATGKLAVVLERCIVDVMKFVSLYILWNLGFTLAFYTMQVRRHQTEVESPGRVLMSIKCDVRSSVICTDNHQSSSNCRSSVIGDQSSVIKGLTSSC
jgi:hypothetical protein